MAEDSVNSAPTPPEGFELDKPSPAVENTTPSDVPRGTSVEASTPAPPAGFVTDEPAPQRGPATELMRQRIAGALGRKAGAEQASVLRQMDPDVDYSGIASPELRAQYSFLDTPEERQTFLKQHFGAENVTTDSFGHDVVVMNGQKVAFLPRGPEVPTKPGALASSWAERAADIAPMAGMAIGSLATAPVPGASIAGAGVGAAGGKGINEIIKQALGLGMQTPTEIAGAMAKEVPAGMVAQATGEALGLAGRSIFRGPFRPGSVFGPYTEKGKISFDKAQQAVDEARALGLKPRVGTYSPNASFTQRVQNAGFRLFGDELPSKNRPILEREAGKLTGGGISNDPAATESLNRALSTKADEVVKVAQNAADAAKADADDLLNKLQQRITGKVGEPSPELAANVSKDVREARKYGMETAALLYAPVDAVAGRPLVTTEGPGMLKDVMQQIISEGPQTVAGKPVFASDTIRAFAKDIFDLPERVSFQQMQVVRSILRDRASVEALNAGLSESQAARLAKAADNAFTEAGKTVPQVAGAMRRADEYYNNMIGRFNDLTVEALVRDASRSGFIEPEKVAQHIAAPGMGDRLLRVQAVLTPETFGQVGAAKWKQMLGEATSPLTGNVDGRALANQLKKMGPTLDVLYGKKEAARMMRYTELLSALNGQIDAETLNNWKLSDAVKNAVAKKEAANETMSRGFVNALRSDGPQSLTAAQWLTEPEHRLAMRQAMGAFGPQSQEVKNLKEYLARRIFSSMEVSATRGAEKYSTTELMGAPLLKELDRYGKAYLDEVFGPTWTESAYKFARIADTATKKNPVDSGGLLAATIGLHWLRHLGEVARYFTAGELLSTEPVITYLSRGIQGSGIDFLSDALSGATKAGLYYGAEEVPKKSRETARGIATHAERVLHGTLPSAPPKIPPQRPGPVPMQETSARRPGTLGVINPSLAPTPEHPVQFLTDGGIRG